MNLFLSSCHHVMSLWLPVKTCTSSGMFSRVSSFTFGTRSVLLFSDAFSKEALIPTRSPRSEFAVTLVTSRPEDAFIDLIANSILGATMF